MELVCLKRQCAPHDDRGNRGPQGFGTGCQQPDVKFGLFSGRGIQSYAALNPPSTRRFEVSFPNAFIGNPRAWVN